jgi:hypothetical protein
MLLKDHSSDCEKSLKVRVSWLVAGMGIAITSISAIEVLLAVRRKKKAQNELLNKETI